MIRKTHGFALLDLLFVCGLMGILCSIALPRLLLAKQAAGSASAIGSMRALNSGELTFALTCGNGFYAPSLTVLGRPPAGSNEGFVTAGLATADTLTRSGYAIQLSSAPYPGAPASCNGLDVGEAGQGFKAGADPIEPGNERFFATNASGTIYEDKSTLYAAIPEVGEPSAGHPLR